MFGLGKKREPEDEFTRGYLASREFSDLVTDNVTDEQLRQQWQLVEANHSAEYVAGYAQYVEDEIKKPCGDSGKERVMGWLVLELVFEQVSPVLCKPEQEGLSGRRP